jgi:hypothetical protein
MDGMAAIRFAAARKRQPDVKRYEPGTGDCWRRRGIVDPPPLSPPPVQSADNSSGSLKPLPPIQPGNSGTEPRPLPQGKPMPPARTIGDGTMYWNAEQVIGNDKVIYGNQ